MLVLALKRRAYCEWTNCVVFTLACRFLPHRVDPHLKEMWNGPLVEVLEISRSFRRHTLGNGCMVDVRALNLSLGYG